MDFKIKIRKAEIITQSQHFWLSTSLDGVIFDRKIQEIGLLGIKIPHNRMNLSMEIIITNKNFYIALKKDKNPNLKKKHYVGYYTQIQVAMGIAGLKWCHFANYVE